MKFKLVSLTSLNLHYNNLTSLQDSIGNLFKLNALSLFENNLTSLPNSISNLTNLRGFELGKNNLKSIPNFTSEFIKNNKYCKINDTSYDINNIDPECKFIILLQIKNEVTNLPINLKEIRVLDGLDTSKIKIPFGCKIKFI